MEIAEAHRVEDRRQQEQVRLDALKTAQERNKLGQFATPPNLASRLARYARALMPDQQIRFLDPAIGSGSFYSALIRSFPAENIAAAEGIEIDPLFSQIAANLWERSGLHVVKGDFTQQHPPAQRFNLVLTNPPYVRHHHLSGADKDRLKAQLARSLSLEISGLAGLYCYFLLHCHDWMEEGGIAIWLIPSEFMDVNYGGTLRRYLTERVTLSHIHRFCPTDVQFTDALVSSAVVVFRKSPPPSGHAARFSFAGPIECPKSEALIPLETLRRSKKWTQFPATTTVADTSELTLGDIFAVKRGLATGSNSFFLLTDPDIRNWQIPRKFLKPILPGPKFLIKDTIESLPDGSPDVSPQLFLLDCAEPEERVQDSWPRFYEYLLRGKEQNIHNAYLASHRTPWYSQEQRPPAPFLCTYMGRSRNGGHPFRFIWNRSRATAHNVYLMLYPKGPLRDALKKHPELEACVFGALQRITSAQLLSEGRVYGAASTRWSRRSSRRFPHAWCLTASRHMSA